LFVGTTNIDYGQTWVWNMSLIAKAGDLELYRKVKPYADASGAINML
jgi:hypothetical protein